MSLDLILPFFPEQVRSLIVSDDVSDVMINGISGVFVDRAGVLSRVPGVHLDADQILAGAENIVRLRGGDLTINNPIFDSRLPGGSRVSVVGSPCSPDGLTITIRKFNRWFTTDDLIASGSLSPVFRDRLVAEMLAKRNILISGSTGSGKTTMLNACIQHIPANERLVVIEKPAELNIVQDNAVRWEAVDELPGRPAITVGHLLAAALRHRPDRIIIGEVRDHSAYDLLQAMNTGHSGTFSTIHADNAQSALYRLSGLALSAHANLDHGFIRSETAAAIHYVLHVARTANGHRYAAEFIQVHGYNNSTREFDTEPVPLTEEDTQGIPNFSH